ncbi:hypothetical protein I203_101545 [Kwoniella mangroviensis CBS 8507]|uniref:uncharacterized protein n=1 Tax=Kwoniella mangroviensis CBS 8507 TaxID=1296122 RepID=UPI00080D4B2A|nr:uncharacterized protein I203_05598 [Kwoniella mangroviensis CBS 8507]OCF65350.1 hypothetical protein I203_05598 [Kwoniella mangroviensis CBS 8507]
MPRITIPNKPFDLFYRISTPSKRDRAKEIDEEYETILFFHPFWVDSFYYYPQFDDPTFYENYNLIAFDAPAHGSTKVMDISPDPVTWSYHATIVKEALTILHIPSVHLVGSTMGCCPAMHFAAQYPDISKNLIMSAPPALTETTNWSLTFRESMHILINAVKNRDGEPLDAITSVIFDYNATSHSKRLVKDLEEECMQLNRSRLLNGELNGEITVPVLISLALSRKQLLSYEQAIDLKCPVLVVQGTLEGWEEHDDQWVDMLEKTHKLYTEQNDGKVCDMKRIVLEGCSRWMTLTHPDLVNPIIHKFISKSKSSISSDSTQDLLQGLQISDTKIITQNHDNEQKTITDGGRRRSSMKKPLSPRDKTEFGVQLSQSGIGKSQSSSIGQVLPKEKVTVEPGTIQTIPSGSGSAGDGVKVQVEVVMKVE